MDNSTNGKHNESSHIRYARLKLKFKIEKEKLRKLKKLFSQEDSTISKERYESLVSEAEKIFAELVPQIDVLKTEIDSQLVSLNGLIDGLQHKINLLEGKIAESKQLYNQKIIAKDVHLNEMKQYKNELEPLLAELKKNKNKIDEIKNALEVDIKTNASTMGGNSETIQLGLTKNGLKGYFAKIKHSDNYLFRFFNTIMMIQALCLLMFVSFRVLLLFDLYNALPITAGIFLIIGIFIIFYFLIISVQAGFGTYFLSSISYFAISIFLFSKMGFFNSFLDSIFADTFTGLMAFWNLIFSIIIFVIGCARTFILGIAKDYKKDN